MYLDDCKWKKVNVVNIDAPKLNIFSFQNHYDMETDFTVQLHIASPEKSTTVVMDL